MRKYLGLAVAALVVVGVLASIAFAGNGPPKKVWICHFADNHTAPATWSGGGTTLDGDYVLFYSNIVDGVPNSNAVSYCSDHGGLGLIQVSAEAAENGHGAQLLDRIAGYP